VSKPLLRLSDVGVRYGDRVALAGVSFSLQPGELVALIGPNGAGKSTLLKAVVGLVPHSGFVSVQGHECHHRPDRLDLAYVAQHSAVDRLFPITVDEVVRSGRRRFGRWWRRDSTADIVAARAALERVGLGDRGAARLSELSGGQVQRVFVARALAQEAKVVLLDEAMAGVDRPTTLTLLDMLHQVTASGAAVVVAMHDLALARRHFDRCLAVNGTLVADGPPEEVLVGDVLESVFGATVAVA
jgi:manganese/iron transport system ATP-binding protein